MACKMLRCGLFHDDSQESLKLRASSSRGYTLNRNPRRGLLSKLSQKKWQGSPADVREIGGAKT